MPGLAGLPTAATLAATLLLLAVPAEAARPPTVAGREANTVAELQAAIEGVQTPNRQGLGVLTLGEVMARFGVPGISVAVIRDFDVHWAKGYGIADVESGAPVDVETLFQAASISKPVTATAVMVAVEEGRLSLDDDINGVLSSWQLPGEGFTEERPVTPRFLLSHTAGLGDGHGFPGYAPGDSRPTPVQILNGEEPSNVGAVTMVRPPLTAMQYSGGGTTIVQLALTDLYGEPFPDLMRRLVLEPVGMAASTFAQPLPPERDANAARAHGRGEAMGEAKSSAETMTSPVGVGGFGVGFSIAREGQGWYFSHSGGNWGFTCYLIAHKVKGYGVAVMTNASGGSAVFPEVVERVQRAYGWDSLDKPTLR